MGQGRLITIRRNGEQTYKITKTGLLLAGLLRLAMPLHQKHAIYAAILPTACFAPAKSVFYQGPEPNLINQLAAHRL